MGRLFPVRMEAICLPYATPHDARQFFKPGFPAHPCAMGSRAQPASLMSPPGRVLKSYARVVLFGLLWCVCLVSTGLAASLPNYITRVWTTDDGLPDSSVMDVIQSHDGYLWVGTRSGLARFDGVRFTVFDSSNTPELPSPHVTCLFEDAKGTIWIGHETGELTCYREGKFRAVPVKATWHGGKIYGMGADPAGDVWLLNGDGELARVKDWFVIPPPPGKTATRLAMARKPGGGFWIQRDNEVWELVAGQLRPVHFDEPPAIATSRGSVPAATEDSGS